MATIKTENLLGSDNKSLDGWTLLSTTVASSDATIDIINLSSDYFVYKFVWYGVKPSIDDNVFGIQISTNNGGDWDSGSTNYARVRHFITMATSPSHTVQGDDLNAEMGMISALGGAANPNRFSDWEITCFNPSGTEYTKFKWEGTAINDDGVGMHVVGGGVRLSAADVDGVRFLMSSGNIATGTLWVYGLKA